MKKFRILILVLLLPLAQLSCASRMTIKEATCEYQVNPLLVACEQPRFGWELASDLSGAKQSAYQVLVSSSRKNLQTGDCWNSGKVLSDQSQLISYAGCALQPGQKYYWAVKVWDESGKPVQSVIRTFTMAPSIRQLCEASWIGAITIADSHLPQGRKDWHVPSFKNEKVRNAWNAIHPLALNSIQLRKACDIQKTLSKANLYISGLGHYELSINGNRIGKSEFDPLWSDYDKTVYYCAYDVKNNLLKGENVIGVLLGNGFYNAVGNRGYNKIWVSFGPPTLLLRLELTYSDGSKEAVLSDASWKYSLSPITYNNIYHGEFYDARLEQEGWNKPGFKEDAWRPVVVQEAPKGLLRPQTAPSVKVMKTYKVQSVKKLSSGSNVLNMGQNLSGYPLIKVQGPKGSVIRIIPGELIENDRVSQKRSGGQYLFEYTLKGEGVETWSPKFSYYGFQYLQIDSADLYVHEAGSKRPLVMEVQSQFVYNSTPETGTFTCSNDLYNRTHVLIQNAVKSNFQGVFTDCPHREKLGWIEEDYLNGPGLFYNYDLTTFMPKLVQDMLDGQFNNGLVPSIVPAYVDFGGDFIDSPEWGVACLVVPWMYYEYYGDASLIRNSYPMMKRYVDYLTTKADSGILNHGLGDWYDYGTHPAGYARNSPVNVSATAHYYYAIDYLLRSAKLLGNQNDAADYTVLLKKVKDSFNRKFFHAETNQYGSSSQFCNAVSLYMGLVDPSRKEEVLQNLLADISAHGNRLTTGDIGNRYLFQALAENDQNEVMYRMTNHYDAPGYGYQLQFGVTTLTEQWDPQRGSSWNHFMMGQIEEWFFKTLAGIQADPTRPGYKHFYISPVLVGDLKYVSASHKTLYGTIRVDWKITGDEFELRVDVPVNTTATIVLPKDKSKALTGTRVLPNPQIFEVGSGVKKFNKHYICKLIL
jgi:alpha-L-rhamnosidase